MAGRISDAGHAVMEVLWDEAPLTAQDVSERVGPSRGWSANTVKTLLGLLLSKNAIAHEADGRRYLYRPPMAVVLAVRAPVRRAFGPQVAHALWTLPALRPLLPPLPSEWREQVAMPIAAAGEVMGVLILPAEGTAMAVEAPRLPWGTIALVAGGFGTLRRFVAFPHDFGERYDADEREFALLHDLGHHRARDLLSHWAALAVLALHCSTRSPGTPSACSVATRHSPTTPACSPAAAAPTPTSTPAPS